MFIDQMPYWLTLFVYIATVSVLGYLIYEDRDPSETAFWTLIILIFPLFGMIAFFFFGRDWRRGTIRSRAEKKISEAAKAKFVPKFNKNYEVYTDKFIRQNKDSWFSRLAVANQANESSLVLPADTFKLLSSGEEGFDSLKADLRAAKKSIHLVFFIWECDELTQELIDIMTERMKHGVEVRLQYDFVGSMLYSKKQLKVFKKAGAQVVSDITDANRLNYRNHRKIAIIDNEIGYTGGINIGQEYIDGGSHYPAWRDTFVRVTGPIVGEMQKVFASRWLVNTGENLYKAKYFPVQKIKNNAIPAQLNYSSSDYYWSVARNAYLQGILSAKKRVYIQSPYFVPDQALFAALETASLSGVDVRLLMTGWPDKKSAWWAAHTFFERLLKAGMKIYFYEEGFMHAKSVLIDDDFSSIGSTNFDARSFTLQKEDTMFFYDKGVNAAHLKSYQNDLKKCREFTMTDYKKLTRLERLRNSASKLLSALF